jgi:hypothetical protein
MYRSISTSFPYHHRPGRSTCPTRTTVYSGHGGCSRRQHSQQQSIAALTAYGETLALERRLKRAEEGRTSAAPQFAEDKAVAAGAVFIQDGGSKGGSPRVRDMSALEAPRATNPSPSRIRQPRRPNTSDSGTSVSVPFSNYVESQPIPFSASPGISSLQFTSERIIAVTASHRTLHPQWNHTPSRKAISLIVFLLNV